MYNHYKNINNKSFYIIFIIITLFLITTTKLLQINTKNSQKEAIILPNYPHTRGTIKDSNGSIIAANIPTTSVYINPAKINYDTESLKLLNKIINKIGHTAPITKTTNNKNLVWIKKHINQTEKKIIKDNPINGLLTIKDSKRFYPQENLIFHILGHVDKNNNGVIGIEKYFNNHLQNNKDLQLSINIKIQNIIRNELIESLKQNTNVSGLGLLINAHNYELLAIANIPDLNPNNKNPIYEDTSLILNKYKFEITNKIIILFIMIAEITKNETNETAKHIINQEQIKTIREALQFVENISSKKTKEIISKIDTEARNQYIQKLDLCRSLGIEIIEKPSATNMNCNTETQLSPINIAQAIIKILHNNRTYRLTLIKDKNNQKINHNNILATITKKNKASKAKAVNIFSINENNNNFIITINIFNIKDSAYCLLKFIDKSKIKPKHSTKEKAIGSTENTIKMLTPALNTEH